MNQLAECEADKSHELRIAVIGNSNTVVRDSFARLLQQTTGIKLVNRSIGSTPNVVLLDFLACEQDLNYDFIIIETAVVDYIQSSGLYSQERSQETLELFIRLIRSRCKAEIIILTIPTRYALLAPQLHWQESLYRNTAARFGIPILDGFRLVRRLIGQRKMNGVGVFSDKAATLASAFRLPPNLIVSLAWRSLRDSLVASNALGAFAFSDHTHVSVALHALMAALLGRFMQTYVPRERDSLPQETKSTGPVVIAAEPIGDNHVARASSLLARDLIRLSPGDIARYQCPKGYRAFGILINDAATVCLLHLGSPAGSTTFDMRLMAKSSDWIAVITPILDCVGDGDIEVTIVEQPPTNANFHRLHGTGNQASPPVAEIGELLLVRSDWRETIPQADAATPTTVRIEDAPWAEAIVGEAVGQAERVIRTIETEGQFIDKPCSQFVAGILAEKCSALSSADQARLLLVMGKSQQLANFLEAACSQQAGDVELERMRAVLHDLRAEDQVQPSDLLSRGIALVRSGATDEAELLFAKGMARFTNEMGFLIERAWISHHRKDWSEALDRWQLVKESFPGHPVGYIGLSASLKGSGRLDDAEKVLKFAVTLFPDSATAAVHHAHIAMDRGDLTEAFSRMKAVRERFEEHWDNRRHLIALAMRLKDFSEARRELSDLVHAGLSRHELVDIAIKLSTTENGFDWIRTIWDQLVQGLPERARVAQQAEALFAQHHLDHDCEFLAKWKVPNCLTEGVEASPDRQVELVCDRFG